MTITFAHLRLVKFQLTYKLINVVNLKKFLKMTALTYHEGHTKMYLYHGLIENGKLNKLLMDQEKDFIELPDDLNNFLERISMPTILFFFVIGGKLYN